MKPTPEVKVPSNFARWISWFFLAGSILGLLYTYYRAEIVLQGEQRGVYFKYYVISLTGVLFWGVVLRLRADMRAKIVTATISLLVSLYLLEGGLTFLGLGQPYARDRAAVATELGIEYDERTKLEVIEDLIAEGVDAVPSFHGSLFRQKDLGHHLYPVGGVSNKTTVYMNESGKHLIYKSDRHGFNNPDAQWNSETIEWLLIGDSFTHGGGVEQPNDEIAGQIRSITRSNTINLGIGGNGPLIEYASLVEYGKALAPEKVLWVYYEGNDLCNDLRLEKKHPLLMQYMQDGFSQNLINRQREIDGRLEEYIEKEKEKEKETKEKETKEKETKEKETKEKSLSYKLRYKTQWIRLLTIRSIIGFDDVDVDVGVVDVDPLFTKILTKAKARVEAWGGELYFVYLPEYGRYNKKAISHDSYRKKPR